MRPNLFLLGTNRLQRVRDNDTSVPKNQIKCAGPPSHGRTNC